MLQGTAMPELILLFDFSHWSKQCHAPKSGTLPHWVLANGPLRNLNSFQDTLLLSLFSLLFLVVGSTSLSPNSHTLLDRWECFYSKLDSVQLMYLGLLSLGEKGWGHTEVLVVFHFLSSFYVFELLIQIESKTHIAIESSDLNMKCVLPCSSITCLNTTCVTSTVLDTRQYTEDEDLIPACHFIT